MNLLPILKMARRDLVKYSNSGLASGRAVDGSGYLISLRQVNEAIKLIEGRNKAWKEIRKANRRTWK